MVDEGIPAVAHGDDALRQIIEARDRTGDSITWLGAVYLGFAAFCVLALLSPDRLMLEGTGFVNVPFTGPMSFGLFVLWAPAALIALRLCLGVYVGRWRKLDARVPAESAPPVLSPRQYPVLHILSALALYVLLPAMLGLFTWKATTRWPWGDNLLFLTIICTIIQAGLLVPFRHFWVRWVLISVVNLVLIGSYILDNIYNESPFRGLMLVREDFRHAYLARRNLQFADLTEANLAGADLTNVRLWDAHLTGANLSGANLTSAGLGDAVLKSADLSGADLTSASFVRANLDRAILVSAILKNASLREANLDHADLSHANLTGANVTGANFKEATLAGAILAQADLSGADFKQAKLAGANLVGAKLEGTAALLADLSGVDFSRANLKNAKLVSAKLADAVFRGATLAGTNFSHAKLTGADFAGADLANADFAGADVTNADFAGAKNGLDLTASYADPAHPPRNLPEGAKVPEKWEARL